MHAVRKRLTSVNRSNSYTYCRRRALHVTSVRHPSQAMVVTNWAKADSGHATSGVQGGTSIMWLNGCAAWICMALYTWTLLAPMLMPDREFS